MILVETPVFTRHIQEVMSDDEYSQLQMHLNSHPDAGKVITSSGGLRKVRWSYGSKGKRGGVRIIYYWAVAHFILLMLYVYPKNEREDLTKKQLKLLSQIVKEEYP